VRETIVLSVALFQNFVPHHSASSCCNGSGRDNGVADDDTVRKENIPRIARVDCRLFGIVQRPFRRSNMDDVHFGPFTLLRVAPSHFRQHSESALPEILLAQFRFEFDNALCFSSCPQIRPQVDGDLRSGKRIGPESALRNANFFIFQ
jgi:hypothetical protein